MWLLKYMSVVNISGLTLTYVDALRDGLGSSMAPSIIKIRRAGESSRLRGSYHFLDYALSS